MMASRAETLSRPRILLVDLGSQYTKVIARILKQLGYRVALLSPKEAGRWLRANPVDAIFLSGGDKSVDEPGSPKVPLEAYASMREDGSKTPIFAICYGMHSVAAHFRGKVASVENLREYGKSRVRLLGSSELFFGLSPTEDVWSSHGDTVVRAPEGFLITAESVGTGGIAAMEDAERRIYTLQFHPEVTHTKNGKVIIRNAVETIAKCIKDWKPAAFVKEVQASVLGALGKDDKAVMGFSGGVDSTTCAKILAAVLGKRLRGIVIDAGQFREGELEEIRRHAQAAGIEIRIIHAGGRFLQAIRGITDAERLRKAFKKIYKQILMEEAGRFGAKFVIQGTLAPDRIESGATGGDLIKSHHNVGLKMPGFVQLHPFEDLFKYEVYALARKLGLPESVWRRHPFPGPGLFLRILGAITQKKLAIVRWADARVTEILKRRGLYNRYSQVVVALMNDKVVGIKGDGRVYKPFVLVRAVKTLDFMTAEGVKFPKAVLEEFESVLSQHAEIVGVVVDANNKPPRTTEPK